MFSSIKLHWKLSQLFARRARVRRTFRARIQSARAGRKSLEALHEISSEASQDDDILTDEIERLVTDHLTAHANRLFISIPERTDQTIWRESSYGEGHLLTVKGIATLRTGVRAEQKECREFIVTVLATLIGIIGAITGLVAVFHK